MFVLWITNAETQAQSWEGFQGYSSYEQIQIIWNVSAPNCEGREAGTRSCECNSNKLQVCPSFSFLLHSLYPFCRFKAVSVPNQKQLEEKNPALLLNKVNCLKITAQIRFSIQANYSLEELLVQAGHYNSDKRTGFRRCIIFFNKNFRGFWGS